MSRTLYESRRPSQRGLRGVLNTSGDLLLTRPEPLPEPVLKALREFLSAPLAAAVAHGRSFGECSFCGRVLTDPRSVAGGYGPICAATFGLPWGEAETG